MDSFQRAQRFDPGPRRLNRGMSTGRSGPLIAMPSDAVERRTSTPTDEVDVIAVGAQGLTAPGFRARVLLLRRDLAEHGVRLEPCALFTEAEAGAFAGGGLRGRVIVLQRARRRLARRLSETQGVHSVALIQRQADFVPSLQLERRAAAGRRLIWDVDDAIWLDASRAAGGHRLAVLKGTARKVRWLASRAEHVVAANDYLADYLSRYSSRVAIVPSVVETRAVRPRRHDDRKELILGWIGSSTTAPYLLSLSDVVSRVARELPDRTVTLLLVGGTMRPGGGFAVESVPWSVETEQEALGRIDVGLMPMPNNNWTRGKSAYKALQYMSAAIPVVADDVGIASSVIESGKAGFVVRSEEEWVEALLTLARSVPVRTRLGEHGRRRVEENYSVTRWAPVVADILRGES
jgi:glycosyltransferase involved in cell wall biosynthesis